MTPVTICEACGAASSPGHRCQPRPPADIPIGRMDVALPIAIALVGLVMILVALVPGCAGDARPRPAGTVTTTPTAPVRP